MTEKVDGTVRTRGQFLSDPVRFGPWRGSREGTPLARAGATTCYVLRATCYVLRATCYVLTRCVGGFRGTSPGTGRLRQPSKLQ
jgi:hypothetical protein